MPGFSACRSATAPRHYWAARRPTGGRARSGRTFAVSPKRPIASPLAAIETCFAERGAPDRSVRHAALAVWPELTPPVPGHHTPTRHGRVVGEGWYVRCD